MLYSEYMARIDVDKNIVTWKFYSIWEYDYITLCAAN